MMEKSWGQMQIENEIRIRNNLREEFDSKPEDFDSAREYYEYMEELEEMGRNICCQWDKWLRLYKSLMKVSINQLHDI